MQLFSRVLKVILIAGTLSAIRLARASSSSSSEYGKRDRLPIEVALSIQGLGKGQEESLQKALYSQQGVAKASKQRLQDFVVAIPTNYTTQGRVAASRASRQGLRTFVVTDYKPGLSSPGPVRYPAAGNETWAYYPDDNPARSHWAGDSRAAMVPFLAFRAFQEIGQTDWKWLFLGLDETLFFADAAYRIVRDLDSELPYVLSDNIWFTSKEETYRPNKDAIRCVPCNYAKNVSMLDMNMTRGCPCTPRVICNLENGYHGKINTEACGPPRLPGLRYSASMAAGMLFSIGLLKQLSLETMESCIKSQWNEAAEDFLTVCLWEAGAALTDPDPLYHPEGLTMFDPVPAPYNPDEHVVQKAGRTLGNLLRSSIGLCTGLCQLERQFTVSLHLSSSALKRHMKGVPAKAQAEASQVLLRAFSRYYALQASAWRADNDASRAQDVSGTQEISLSHAANAKFTAGEQYLANMPFLFKANETTDKFVTASVDPLLAFIHAEAVSLVDQGRTGAATAVAQQVLEVILKDMADLI